MDAIYVFSYNRGTFLEHCVRSIDLCAGRWPVIIIDDGSDDAHTQRALERLSSTYEVVVMDNRTQTEFKCGGLYSSMNYALEDALYRGYRRVLFTQDDMQFVRRISREDLEAIDLFFHCNDRAIQIQVNFIAKMWKDIFYNHFVIDKKNCSAYVSVSDSTEGKTNFSDTGIFDVQRVRSMLGYFRMGEGENNRVARAKGVRLGWSVYPFVCWLPYPTSHRGRARSLAHRLVEWLGGAGFHPIDLMTNEDVENFLSRAPSSLPIAERFLRSPTVPRRELWSWGGRDYNILCRGGWRAAAFRAAMGLRKHMRGMVE